MDFRLEDSGGVHWIETKSVALVEQGVARFPDVPTARGRILLLTLGQAARKGVRASVIFIIQRPDAQVISPNVAPYHGKS
ncbi:MAG: DNA/RNA nuclease SfsA [Anaerolineales bacterium]|nr:DNA/RNA nuclease SfsA [Chloroflexota bacterium]MBL6983258.1 DNA/RNA nuclease SfsA [Anaerolineales bacterium]